MDNGRARIGYACGKELRQHGEIMDMMALPRSSFSKINIHIGGAYGDKKTALERFIKNVSRLPETAERRITIENDDKFKDPDDLNAAHADFISKPALNHGHLVDIMLEAKAKEQAVLQYIELFRITPNSFEAVNDNRNI
ncbi:MAG TPA: hypothetical protein VJ184_16300 [Chryseolinea sp.]|nr:hypothetical protein [Chryseolinea sp.]